MMEENWELDTGKEVNATCKINESCGTNHYSFCNIYLGKKNLNKINFNFICLSALYIMREFEKLCINVIIAKASLQ